MGSHATGTVFWGYDLGDLTNDEYEFIGPSWLDEGDEERGLGPDYKEPAYVLAEAIGIDPADAKAVYAFERQYPVELAYYGHVDGDVLYRVVVRASETEATYECVRLGALLAPLEWQTQIAEFMRIMQLPVPADPPGWFLTSDYG